MAAPRFSMSAGESQALASSVLAEIAAQNARAAPHYTLPHAAAAQSEYVNAEAEIVQQSFNVGSLRLIRELPDAIVADQVLSARSVRRQRAVEASPAAVEGRFRWVAKSDLFQRLPYEPSPLDEERAAAADERRAHRARVDALHGRPFRAALKAPEPPRCVSLAAGETALRALDEARGASRDDARRTAWLRGRTHAAAPFRVGGNGRALAGATRAQLPEMVACLRRKLDGDWGDVVEEAAHGREAAPAADVYADEDDVLVLRFALSALERGELRGVLAYMTTLAEHDADVARFSLRRAVELWGHEPGDDGIYFAFRPPWVHTRAVEVYHTVFPERAPGAERVEVEEGVDGCGARQG